MIRKVKKVKEKKEKTAAMPAKKFETMKAEHRFFTESFRKSNKMLQEIEMEKESQSDEAKVLEEQKLSKKFMEIVKQAEAEREKILRLFPTMISWNFSILWQKQQRYWAKLVSWMYLQKLQRMAVVSLVSALIMYLF